MVHLEKRQVSGEFTPEYLILLARVYFLFQSISVALYLQESFRKIMSAVTHFRLMNPFGLHADSRAANDWYSSS